MESKRTTKILLEMRPALEGHAGIPQETRLLFRGLKSLPGIETEGLIQSSSRLLAKGLPANGERAMRMRADRRMDRLSRVVISLQPNLKPGLGERLLSAGGLALSPLRLLGPHVIGMGQTLTRFDPSRFRDFIWRSLFAKTLPYEDFDLVTQGSFRVARVPWEVMHGLALATRMMGYALYPRLSTGEFDIMIAETPYPGRVASRTRMIVRYHDAIPVLMPHTISDKAVHQASHFHALRRNVKDGAWFACVSDATRRDLISIFPEAEERSITIHNMVSHHYFSEASSALRIPEVIRTRMHSGVRLRAGAAGEIHDALGNDGNAKPVNYLLIVSTIEPRKNHLSLLSAWEQLRTERYPDLKLVIVGMLGWDHLPIVKKFRPWLDRGELYMLEDVPSGELRLLYKHAKATVCPSFGEGFDFSGVEAMRCGGVVAASDIPVHREVYGDAAEYFSPYASREIANAIVNVIDSPDGRRAELIKKGAVVAEQYTPEAILPKWQAFLQTQMLSVQKN